MRAVARGKAPPVLTLEHRAGPKELIRAREHINDPQNANKSFSFQAYSDDGVKLALLDLFHGKCAYCESFYASQAPVDVEHYRPKNAVEGEGNSHRGYWWLAMAWDNLLPSCIDCNRRRWQSLHQVPPGLLALHLAPPLENGRVKLGKEAHFPILGMRAKDEGDSLADESALLLDPTRDNPAEHLLFYIDFNEPVGLVLPKAIDETPSPRGIASIHVYGLNRLGLVQERTRILRKLTFMAEMIDGLVAIIEELSGTGSTRDLEIAVKLDHLIDRITKEIKDMSKEDQPHCSLVRAWVEALEAL